MQDVHTKRWTDADEADKIEARKKIGLKKDVDKEKLKTVGINSSIEQRNNDTGKPSAILHYDTDLNTRQQKILNDLPEYDSRTIVKKSEVSMIDLSAMTAKTGDEFAMFTKGGDRMLVRGNTTSVNINEEEAAQLAAEGYTWSGHTHPGTAQNVLLASNGDRLILEQFDQDTSVVYDSLGRHLTFTKG